MVSYLRKKYETAYKENLKENKTKKNPTWYIIVALMILLIYSGLATFSVIKKYNWVYIISAFVFIASIAFVRYLKDKKLEVIINVKDKAEILKDILIEEKLTTAKQIEFLMETVKQKLILSKVSTELFKPFSTFFSSIILTLLSLIAGWVFSKTEPSVTVFKGLALVLIILLQVFGLYLTVKPAVEEVLDREYLKTLEFQGILENTYLIYFCDNASK
jgi:hypothetical protein